MDPEQREVLRFGCILHDIGKIGIEEGALDARDASDAEQVFYRMHPLIGRGILQPVGFLERSLPVVVHHHERWDGHGFPEGLRGDDIPLHARICAIVDAYERLRNPQRLGAVPLSPNQAMEEILAGAGTRFDPGLVAQLHRLMCSEETGVCTDPFTEEPSDLL
jgi:HD-GYP domain-containing protein (c-di-GMP phosphodiesterase class II)